MSNAQLSDYFYDKTVTANYGNFRNYKIIEIDFKKNPLSTFKLDNNK